MNARTTLLELFTLLRDGLAARHLHLKNLQPVHRDFRAGDVLHSQADIGKAQRLLGYEPTHTIGQGLSEALGWYKGQGRGGYWTPTPTASPSSASAPSACREGLRDRRHRPEPAQVVMLANRWRKICP